MALILKGKPVAEAVLDTVKERVCKRAATGAKFAIASLRVGNNADDASYERSIARACEKTGIDFLPIVFKSDVETHRVLSELDRLNENELINGLIVFQPMPTSIDSQKVRDSISPYKDIDCISDASLGNVLIDGGNAFAPATAEAVIKLCDYYGIELAGSNVVVVGRSRVIGKPVGMLALDRNATVTFCHSRTRDLPNVTRGADIVICAVGKANFFDTDYFRAGQCVIDVGMNVNAEGSLCGDVAFEEVEPIVDAITPVPGGIGAITTSILLEHATRDTHATSKESE